MIIFKRGMGLGVIPANYKVEVGLLWGKSMKHYLKSKLKQK
jgi:hypothetical protein